jgi:chromosome segregation ATPase
LHLASASGRVLSDRPSLRAMDQKTKEEQLQKKDKEGLLTFIGVLSTQAKEQKKKLEAEAEEWKAEAEKWKAEAEKLKAENVRVMAMSEECLAGALRNAPPAPPAPYEPPWGWKGGTTVRMRGGRMNMSDAEVDKEAAEGRIFRATILEKGSLPTHLRIAEAAKAKVFDPPSTRTEANAQVQELKDMIKDVEARMMEPRREIDVAQQKVSFLLAEMKALDAAKTRAMQQLGKQAEQETLFDEVVPPLSEKIGEPFHNTIIKKQLPEPSSSK